MFEDLRQEHDSFVEAQQLYDTDLRESFKDDLTGRHVPALDVLIRSGLFVDDARGYLRGITDELEYNARQRGEPRFAADVRFLITAGEMSDMSMFHPPGVDRLRTTGRELALGPSASGGAVAFQRDH